MRIIKFRGKRCDNGEWVYGHYLESTKTWHGCHPHKAWILTDAMTNGGFFALLGRHAVINESVGQYTGLTDAKGMEIYEGDIIKNGTFVGVVDWNPIGNFFINENYGKRQDKCISLGEMLENYDFIVVGNIHDNPDSMKGGKE